MEFIIIENDPAKALEYESAGIDRIMVDLETLGKAERQRGLNSVQSRHSFEDIINLKNSLTKSALMVRSNPWNNNSSEEIERIVDCGADIIMLPMFKRVEEVEFFLKTVNCRAKTILLLETPQALVRTEEILKVGGFDELFVGLNDLSLAMSLGFMFELLAGGIVEHIGNLCKKHHLPFGFGGIGTLNSGQINGLSIIQQHVRLSSSLVILSQTFKNEITKLHLNVGEELKLIKSAYLEALELSPSEHAFLKERTFEKIWEIGKDNLR